MTTSDLGARTVLGRGVHDALRDRVREKEGRQKSPSAAILDSQSVKTTEKGAPEATMQGKRTKGASGTLLLTPLV